MSGTSSSVDFKSAGEDGGSNDEDVFEVSNCHQAESENPYEVSFADDRSGTAKSTSMSSSVASSVVDEEKAWGFLTKGSKGLFENAVGMLHRERLWSFVENKWPYNVRSGHLCHPKSLALAGLGFHSLEPTPTAQCQVCLKKFENLKPNSNPWILHLEGSPDCYFVKLGQRDEPDDYTMDEFMEMVFTRIIHVTEDEIKKRERTVKNQLFELRQLELQRQKKT